MNDQLESELRAVFASRAAEVSGDAVERLRRVDFRPRLRRRWPLTMSAVAAASGTAAVVSAVVLGGTQAAFAGWDATPTAPTSVQSAATQGGCQAELATAPGADQGTWSQVATDVRGPYTMVVDDNGSNLASCFSGPSFTTFEAESLTGSGMAVSASSSGSAPASGPGGVSGSNSVEVLSGADFEQLLVSHLSQSANGAYTLVEGRLAPAVRAVTLVLSDGQDVTATSGNGWIVAWWPGSEDVAAAQVTTASGTTTESLTVGHLPHPPPPSSSSTSTSGSLSAGPSSPTPPTDTTP